MPDVTARLESAGARVADVGCGCGWSSIAIVRGFPNVTVIGIDTDEASIADARANAAETGVSDRVTFTTVDADSGADGQYDLVTCFEALHDMAHPVDALTAMRRMAGPDGAVLIMDERAADTLTPNDPDPMQRLFYAASVLHCLPVGRSEEGSAATGTVLRTSDPRGLRFGRRVRVRRGPPDRPRQLPVLPPPPVNGAPPGGGGQWAASACATARP